MSTTPLLSASRQTVKDSDENRVERWLNPLIELSVESPSLILGYGGKQPLDRSEMIPYFHVCGRSGNHRTLRVLLVGGWLGNEIDSTWVIASFLTEIEQRLRLLAGIEVTAYPVINRDALREGTHLTAEQHAKSLRLWEGSDLPQVEILERELWRYDYDLAVVLRQAKLAHGFSADVWPSGGGIETVMSDALRRYAAVDNEFAWSIRPTNPRFPRVLTPVPERGNQPTEVLLSVPGAEDQGLQAKEATGLLLTVLHAARQARAEGLI